MQWLCSFSVFVPVPDGSGIGPDLKIGPFTLTVLYKERSDLHGGFEFLTIGGTRTIRRD